MKYLPSSSFLSNDHLSVPIPTSIDTFAIENFSLIYNQMLFLVICVTEKCFIMNGYSTEQHSLIIEINYRYCEYNVNFLLIFLITGEHLKDSLQT